MSLETGGRFGQYEVLSLIGKGGMGEVYRARDTQLKRDAALKVISQDFANDPERLARFQREAELLASLNHPHIATLYGLIESGENRALAMEFVDGAALSARPGIERALAYAKQIAEALEYAHEKGVIHRDLKPDNIRVTADGDIKLLDFGLAKAIDDPQADRHDPANSPTLTLGHTRVGVIMGTAAYMSPEQASGGSADRRSDIWSFGAVLYEMLAEKRAFEGASVTETLASVLKMEPDWSALPAETPPSVRGLIERCLTKDRKQRLQAIGEARIVLSKPFSPAARAGSTSAAGSNRLWMTAAALGVLAAPAAWFLRPKAEPSKPVTVEIAPPKGADFGAQDWQFVLSPDGRHAVLIAESDRRPGLWIRNMDTGDLTPLLGTQFPRTPFWSPDSRYVGFFAEGKLKKIAIAGGQPQILCDATLGFANWSSQGVILFEEPGKPLQKVPENGGRPVNAMEFDKGRGEIIQTSPYFLPDGKRYVYGSRTNTAVRGIAFASLERGPIKFLIQNRNSPGSYAPDPEGGPGWIVYNTGGRLFAQRFDPDKEELVGEPKVLAESVQAGPNWSHSGNGILSFPHLPEVSNQLAWYRRDGTKEGAIGEAGRVGNPKISPDGRSVAFTRAEGTNTDIWVQDPARGTPQRLTFEPGPNQVPLWTPDGSRIVYSTNREGVISLVERPANGLGAEAMLKTFPNQDGRSASAFTGDGRWMSVNGGGGGAGYLTLMSRPDGKEVRFPDPVTRGEISADGRWILYSTVASGRSEVFVESTPKEAGGPATRAKFQVSANGGAQPHWRPDGREIFYLSLESDMVAASVESGEGFFRPGTPRTLFRAGRISAFDVDPAGQRFILNQPSGEARPNPITIIVNWMQMLQ